MFKKELKALKILMMTQGFQSAKGQCGFRHSGDSQKPHLIADLVGTKTCSPANALLIRSKTLVLSPFLVFNKMEVQPKSCLCFPAFHLTNHWLSQLAPLGTHCRLCVMLPSFQSLTILLCQSFAIHCKPLPVSPLLPLGFLSYAGGFLVFNKT